MLGLLIGTRCRRCSKFRNPAEFIGGPYGYCLQCYENHSKALAAIQSGVATECQECGVSPHALFAASGSDDLRMELHIKDGIYQVLCLRCGDEYARKRGDLYQGTPYAKDNKH